MKTIEEIILRVAGPQAPFDFGPDALVIFLPFEHAKTVLSLKEGTTEEDWEKVRKPLTRDTLIEVMRDYMAFAWEKATGHRGLSASRSVSKFMAWVWLLDEPAVTQEWGGAKYPQYGCPKLMALSKALGFPVPEGERVQRMARGEPCCDGCDEGCG